MKPDRFFASFAAAAALLTALAAPAADALKSTNPAKVGTLVKEGDLNTITLTPQAEQRLGIATVAVERKSVPRSRSFGGDVMIRAGGALTVTAPVAATVVGALPQPGAPVKRGQTLCQLRAILSPTERVNVATTLSEAQGTVAGFKATLAAARHEKTKELRAALEAWWKDTGAGFPTKNPGFDETRWWLTNDQAAGKKAKNAAPPQD